MSLIASKKRKGGEDKYKITLAENSIDSYSLSTSLSGVEEEGNTLIRKLIEESIQENNRSVAAHKKDCPRYVCLFCSREHTKFKPLPGMRIIQETICKRVLELRKTDNQYDPDPYSQEKILSVDQGHDWMMVCTDCSVLC